MGIKTLELDLKHWIEDAHKECNSISIIVQKLESVGWPNGMSLMSEKGYTTEIGHKQMISFMIKIAKQKKFEVLRELLDIEWNTNYSHDNLFTQSHQICNTREKYDECHVSIRDHILNTYLFKKLVKYSINDNEYNLIIKIPRNYNGDEGKIFGMWEQFKKYNRKSQK